MLAGSLVRAVPGSYGAKRLRASGYSGSAMIRLRFPLGFPSLCSCARRYCRLGTGSDVRGVLVQSNVLMTARTLEYLHLRSDVSSFPVSSSQFLYTSTCFPCRLQNSIPVRLGFLHPATALHRQHDIRTLSLTTIVPSLHLLRWGDYW